VQFVLLFKIEKKLKIIYCTCEPLLFMKDDNYVDKSSMKKQMNKALQRKNGDFFLLVREDNFTQWIEKALLLCMWQSNRRLESTLKEENRKYN
jgi:hypothetical protein